MKIKKEDNDYKDSPFGEYPPEYHWGFTGAEIKPPRDILPRYKIKTKSKNEDRVRVAPFEEVKYDIENLTEIEFQKIDQFNAKVENLTEDISNTLLQMSTASLLAQERAAANVQAIARDILGIDIEIDNSAVVAIAQLSKIKLITMHIETLKLPTSIKNEYLSTITQEIAKQTLTQMTAAESHKRFSNSLQNTVASYKSRSPKPVIDKSPSPNRGPQYPPQESAFKFTGDQGNNMGMVRKRTYYSRTEDLMEKSREQVENQRFKKDK